LISCFSDFAKAWGYPGWCFFDARLYQRLLQRDTLANWMVKENNRLHARGRRILSIPPVQEFTEAFIRFMREQVRSFHAGSQHVSGDQFGLPRPKSLPEPKTDVCDVGRVPAGCRGCASRTRYCDAVIKFGNTTSTSS
jgi:hypothetical protein